MMPRLDGTGPLGRGPLTGWGRGVCNQMGGRGLGARFCKWFGWNQPTNLKDYKESLKKELTEVEKELADQK